MVGNVAGIFATYWCVWRVVGPSSVGQANVMALSHADATVRWFYQQHSEEKSMHITGVKWGALAMVATLAACGGSDNHPYPTLNGRQPLSSCI